MAFNTIYIETQLPIINGFVVIPGQEIVGRYKLEAIDVTGSDGDPGIIPGSSTLRLGQKPVDDLRLALPEFNLRDYPIFPSDYYQILRDA